ncbi:MAG: trigger factor [bacterium]
MKVEVTSGEGLVRVVQVEIPSEKVQGKLGDKFAEIRKKADIKGFRKGKVPMDTVKQMFGDEVKADVVEDLIRTTYGDAIEAEKLRVCAHPTLTKADFTDDGGFAYTAEVEVFPEIESIDYDGLTVTIPEVVLKDSDVDEFLLTMRQRLADRRPVERPAEATDMVEADLKPLEDPKGSLENKQLEGQHIDLSNQNTMAAFRLQIPGMKAGDSKEIEISYPDDYPDKDYAGATVRYEVKIKEVIEQILPEVNDAFAKQTGQAETALELRLKIRAELEERIKSQQERVKRGQIIGQLCDKNAIPVPQALLQRYLKGVTEDFKKKYDDVNEKEIQENYNDVGIKTIRWNLLYNKLSEQEKIEVLPSDTETRIKRFADNYNMTVDEAKKALAQSVSVDEIRDSILEEKVLDFLSEKAKVDFTKDDQAK